MSLRLFRYLLTFILFLGFVPQISLIANDSVKILTIASQSDFDRMRGDIVQKLDSHNVSKLVVKFEPGTYYYDRNNYLNWGKKNWSDCDVELIGDSDVLLIARLTTVNDNISWRNGSIRFRNVDGVRKPYHYERWTKFASADTTCVYHESDDAGNPYFQLLAEADTLPLNIPDASFIQFTEWYRSHVYPVRTQGANEITFGCEGRCYVLFEDNDTKK